METHGVDWGSRETNGCGTFNGVTDKALREIARMGFTHIWLTGVLRHATQTSHPGLAAQPKSIVKGLAGSPYAVVDYFDVDPDLASSPEKRMDEFKALVKALPDGGAAADDGFYSQPCFPSLPGGLGRA